MQLSGQRRQSVLCQYFLITYLLLLINVFSYLKESKYSGAITLSFSIAVYFTYSLLYLLPFFFLTLSLERIISLIVFRKSTETTQLISNWIIYSCAVFGSACLQIIIFVDKSIYEIFGFHINGFVWNLVCTPGGLDSMECSTSAIYSYIVIIAGLVVVQALLMVAVLRVQRVRWFWEHYATRRVVTIGLLMYLAVSGFQGVTYGMSSIWNYTPVLFASDAFPLYLPLTFRNIAKSLGVNVEQNPSISLPVNAVSLHYPLRPIVRSKKHNKYNIVWLVAEAFRADMLDPAIMPRTYAFAQRSAWFTQHYSGGNGTRMAMFSMFYGLYGSYWFSFLAENRGPLIFDLLLKDGYQMQMFTSAKFSYPEFDRTIFASIPKDCLHESKSGATWKRDRENVSELLDFINRRDLTRPFMTFMFFESPHAKYEFPGETAIRQPYVDELNYANMRLEKNAALIKNRYINACNHLDTQFNRILEYLTGQGLLDSTIILITGDHGEEFMEKGRWGHGSDFTEEQTRTPLVLWIPGNAPREVSRMTSHLDIPATILPLLGVTNPPEDYSLGFDLLGVKKRDFAILSDWDKLAYVDEHFKTVFSTSVYGVGMQKVTRKNDSEVKDKVVFFESNRERLVQIMQEMKRFSNHRGRLTNHEQNQEKHSG